MPVKTMYRWGLMVGLLAALAAIAPAYAAAVPGQIEVPVADESEAARPPAVAKAISALMVRLTGRPDVVDLPVGEQIRAQASSYLQGFSYRQGPAARGQSDANNAEQTWLNTRFDASRLRDVLVRRGVKVWPERPPRLLVWVAIEGEAQRRFSDEQADAQLHRALREQASALGVQVLFPLLDLEDRQALRPADVAAGFVQPIQAASARYAPERILSVRINDLNAERVTGRWMLMSDETVLQRWRTANAALDASVEQSAQRVVAQLRQDLAYLPDLFASGRLQIVVAGIDGLMMHDRIAQRLESLAGVERVTTLAIEGDAVRYGLAITTPEAGVREAIERDSRLLADGEQYRWQ